MKNLSKISFFFLLFLIISCQTSKPKEETKKLVTTYDFKYVLYIYYDNDDGGWQPHTGSISIDENKFQITTNNGIETVTDTPIIKSVTYQKDDNDYLYKTNMGKILVNMDGDSIKDITIFSTNAMATFALENYKEKKGL